MHLFNQGDIIVLKLNADGYALCEKGLKRATLRLGERDASGVITIENLDTAQSMNVTVKENVLMKYSECLNSEDHLSLLGYSGEKEKFDEIMKKSYPSLEKDSLVSLISW